MLQGLSFFLDVCVGIIEFCGFILRNLVFPVEEFIMLLQEQAFVYSLKRLNSQFYFCFWVCVSPEFQKKQVQIINELYFILF